MVYFELFGENSCGWKNSFLIRIKFSGYIAAYGREGKWLFNYLTPSPIRLLTPESVHYDRAEQIIKERGQVLLEAFSRNPKRFKGRIPIPMALPQSAWINPPTKESANLIRH
jgi:hypothetical protein